MDTIKDALRRFWYNESYIATIIKGSISAYSILGLVTLSVRATYKIKDPSKEFESLNAAEILFVVIALTVLIYCGYNYIRNLREGRIDYFDRRQTDRLIKRQENLIKKLDERSKAQAKLKAGSEFERGRTTRETFE